MDISKFLESFDATTLAALSAGIALIASWLGGKTSFTDFLAKAWSIFQPSATTVPATRPHAITPTTTSDVKLATDRLAVVAAKVDELATTRIWLQQTEDAIRKEIASVRACADAMESRLKASPAVEITPS